MTSRERVVKALRFECPDQAPRDLWALPAIQWFRADELNQLRTRFPMDFTGPTFSHGEGRRSRGTRAALGGHVDAWGSQWQVLEAGRIGEVKRPAIADWSAFETYELPWELLREADFSEVNRSCHETDRFVCAPSLANPYERLQFLRGTENLLIDLAYGTPEVYRLRDMVHEFFLTEMQMWAKTDVDGMLFLDDLGSQQSLLISPDLFRSFFKPLYRDYCDIIRGAGKFVFFHSDGHIEAVFPDLVEIGVHAINSQLFCMDIEGLAAKYRGKLTFWGEIDRQHILPLGSTDEVRAAVRRVRAAFDDGRGGLIAQCEWGIHDPMENIAAVYDEWSKPPPPRCSAS